MMDIRLFKKLFECVVRSQSKTFFDIWNNYFFRRARGGTNTAVELATLEAVNTKRIYKKVKRILSTVDDLAGLEFIAIQKIHKYGTVQLLNNFIQKILVAFFSLGLVVSVHNSINAGVSESRDYVNNIAALEGCEKYTETGISISSDKWSSIGFYCSVISLILSFFFSAVTANDIKRKSHVELLLSCLTFLKEERLRESLE